MASFSRRRKRQAEGEPLGLRSALCRRLRSASLTSSARKHCKRQEAVRHIAGAIEGLIGSGEACGQRCGSHRLDQIAGEARRLERRQIVAQTHEIGLLFGDNLSDFSAVFDRKPYAERNEMVQANAALFGDRFIVLPNAMYGDWEGALYNFDFKHSPAQRDTMLTKQLRTY